MRQTPGSKKIFSLPVTSWIFIGLLVIPLLCNGFSHAQSRKEATEKPGTKEAAGEFSWEMPGRVSIYDLQFGPAVLQNNEWKFVNNGRTFNAGPSGERLTLMVRFAYKGSRADIPVKFVVKLPGSRQYEETVQLTGHKGQYSYKFTIHNPGDFVGNGSIYLYYGFSIVDVLDFTIMPGG